jgi:hypothetical protein
MTTEFDQIFEEMSAPEYLATCDECGEEGTNASMEEHVCAVVTPCAECGGVSGERYQRHKASCSFVKTALGYDPQLQPESERAVGDQTPLDRLIKAAESLVAMNTCNYDRETMRSENGFLKLEQAALVAKEYVENHAQLVAALEQAHDWLTRILSGSVGEYAVVDTSDAEPVRDAIDDALSRVRG